MKYLLFGAGLFGKSLAEKLVELGARVLLLDRNEDALESVHEFVTAEVIADVGDKEVLKDIIELYKPDGAVVCFGESFNTTLLTVIYLKEFGVKNISARASSVLQGEILKRLGVNSVILPEVVMGERYAGDLVFGEGELLHLDNENSIARIRVPEQTIGKTLPELEPQKFGVSTLFIHREYVEHKVSKFIQPSENPKLEKGDNLVLLGSPRRIVKFVAKISG